MKFYNMTLKDMLILQHDILVKDALSEIKEQVYTTGIKLDDGCNKINFIHLPLNLPNNEKLYEVIYKGMWVYYVNIQNTDIFFRCKTNIFDAIVEINKIKKELIIS